MKFSTVRFFSKLITILVYLSRSVLIPFLPLYLKYLNLSLLQMGFIRAVQMLTTLIFTSYWIRIENKFSSTTTKRACISGTTFTLMTICICLLFVPPYESAQSVIHCEGVDVNDSNAAYRVHSKSNSYNSVENITYKELIEQNDHIVSTEEVTSTFHLRKQASVQNTATNNFISNHTAHSEEIFYEHITESGLHDGTIEKTYAKTPKEEEKEEEDENSTTGETTVFAFATTEQYKYSTGLNKGKSSQNDVPQNDVTSQFLSFTPTLSDNHKATLPYRYSINKKNSRGRFAYPHGNIQQKMLNTLLQIKEDNTPYYSNGQNEQPFYSQDDYQFDYRKHQQQFDNSQNAMDRTNYHMLPGSHSVILPNKKEISRYVSNEKEGERSLHFGEREESFEMKIPGDIYNAKQNIENWRNKRSVAVSLGSNRQSQKSSNADILKRLQPTSVNANVSLTSKVDDNAGKNIFQLLRMHHLFSETFLTVLFLSFFYEVMFSQIIPWTETLSKHSGDEYCDHDDLFCVQVFSSKNYLWLITYPLISVLVVMAPCTYQVSMHCFIAAVVLAFSFLITLIFLSLDYPRVKHFRSRKPSKPSFTEKHFQHGTFQKILSGVTNMLIGACAACYTEFILWNAGMLPDFPFNYEYLYCGYYFLCALSCLATGKYLQYKSINRENNLEDSESEEEYVHFSYDWLKKSEEIIYERNQKSNMVTVMGTLLMSVILFIVPFMVAAWSLLPLALMKGVSDALLEAAIPEGSWSTVAFGYGLGCFVGSVIGNAAGINVLFYVASSSIFICSIIWLCYSIKIQSLKESYAHSSLEDTCDYSKLDVSQNCKQMELDENDYEEDDDDGDWLEKALRKEEFSQSKKLLQ